jgi:hypothetical protein
LTPLCAVGPLPEHAGTALSCGFTPEPGYPHGSVDVI